MYGGNVFQNRLKHILFGGIMVKNSTLWEEYKKTIRLIADYIAKAGIDYYLDEEDVELQDADEQRDDEKTVKCIQNALKCSTHVLCILSEITVTSWWVPYEIEYGEKSEVKIASLKIKNLPECMIPSFLRIRNCMMGLLSLITI